MCTVFVVVVVYSMSCCLAVCAVVVVVVVVVYSMSCCLAVCAVVVVVVVVVYSMSCCVYGVCCCCCCLQHVLLCVRCLLLLLLLFTARLVVFPRCDGCAARLALFRVVFVQHVLFPCLYNTSCFRGVMNVQHILFPWCDECTTHLVSVV